MFYVLILESDPVLRDATVAMIRNSVCQPVAVADLPGALGALSGIRFDVLMAGLSHDSPDLRDFIVAVKASYPKLRVIAGASQRGNTRQAGIVDAYLDSPLDHGAVRAALRLAFTYAGTRLAAPGGG